MGGPRATAASRVAELIAGHRDPRSRLLARGSGLELYYEPGDPHSHLCAQLLPLLRERVAGPINVRLVGESGPEDYPERERQRAYALADAARIAPAFGLRFPADPVLPAGTARRWAAEQLAGSSLSVEEFTRREPEIAAALFAGAGGRPARDPATGRLLAANAQRRRRLGHNLPAVWQYDGDWFWALDRLDHLAARLRARGALVGERPLAERRPQAARLPSLPDPLPRLEFFFSFRSPYSYLAAVRMNAFHREWPAGVEVRPVLPMAMRNITVPSVKRFYTLRDAKREADRQGIPFGRAADPLGEGARRCLQIFPLAGSEQAQLELLASAGRAIWSRGIDLATDEGLRHVCEEAGIEWPAARELLAADPELEYAERNRADLLAAGLWGVPCYRAGSFTAWGQDRFWMLEELLRRAADGRRSGGRRERAAEPEHLARQDG